MGRNDYTVKPVRIGDLRPLLYYQTQQEKPMVVHKDGHSPFCALLVYLSARECTSWKLYVHNLGVSILVHYHSAQTVHSLCMQAFLL